MSKVFRIQPLLNPSNSMDLSLEYIKLWEQVNNPAFNYGEFATVKNKSGLNNFKISVKEFAEKTKPNCHTTNESIARGRKQEFIEVNE